MQQYEFYMIYITNKVILSNIPGLFNVVKHRSNEIHRNQSFTTRIFLNWQSCNLDKITREKYFFIERNIIQLIVEISQENVNQGNMCLHTPDTRTRLQTSVPMSWQCSSTQTDFSLIFCRNTHFHSSSCVGKLTFLCNRLPHLLFTTFTIMNKNHRECNVLSKDRYVSSMCIEFSIFINSVDNRVCWFLVNCSKYFNINYG